MSDFLSHFKDKFSSDADETYAPGNQHFSPNQQRSGLTSRDPDGANATPPSNESTNGAVAGSEPRTLPPQDQLLLHAQDCPRNFSDHDEEARDYSENHSMEWGDQSDVENEYSLKSGPRQQGDHGIGTGNAQHTGEGSRAAGRNPGTEGRGTVRNGASLESDLMGISGGAVGGSPVGEYPRAIEDDDAQELAHNGCNGNTGNHSGHSHGGAGGPGVG